MKIYELNMLLGTAGVANRRYLFIRGKRVEKLITDNDGGVEEILGLSQPMDERISKIIYSNA